jgi:hypothetical protein
MAERQNDWQIKWSFNGMPAWQKDWLMKYSGSGMIAWQNDWAIKWSFNGMPAWQNNWWIKWSFNGMPAWQNDGLMKYSGSGMTALQNDCSMKCHSTFQDCQKCVEHEMTATIKNDFDLKLFFSSKTGTIMKQAWGTAFDDYFDVVPTYAIKACFCLIMNFEQ